MNIPSIVMWDGRTLDRGFFEKCRANDALVFVQFNTTKKEVNSSDFSRIDVMLDSVTGLGHLALQSLLLCFAYDDDPRELVQIPEVARYIRRIDEKYPYLFYYLVPQLSQHIFTCQVPHLMLSAPLVPSRAQKLIQLDMEAACRKFVEISEAVKAYGASIGDEAGARDALREWRQTLNL